MVSSPIPPHVCHGHFCKTSKGGEGRGRGEVERRGRRGIWQEREKERKGHWLPWLHSYRAQLWVAGLPPNSTPIRPLPLGSQVSYRRVAHPYSLNLLATPSSVLAPSQTSHSWVSIFFIYILMSGPGLFFCHCLLYFLYRLSHNLSPASITT